MHGAAAQAVSLFEDSTETEMTGSTAEPSTGPGKKPKNLARSILQKLWTIRRELTAEEMDYLPEIEACIEGIRLKDRLTATQKEELVLYSIEYQGAVTVTEIAGDTRTHPDLVKAVLADLEARGEVYQVPRYVPGSDRPQKMWKSKRMAVPEVTGEIIGRPVSRYDTTIICVD